MQHASRPALRHAREVSKLLRGLADQKHPLAGAPTNLQVAESWQRSFTVHGLRPDRGLQPHYLDAGELQQRQERLETVYRIGREELEQLQKQLRGGGFSVLLADQYGCIVRRVGERRLDRAFREAGLAPGADWSEAAVGTNGIGTAITRRQPTLIHADQHFLTDNINLSCAAVPIGDGRGGLIAVLDASALNPALAKNKRERTMTLVRMAARSIENALLLDSVRDQWVIAFHARPEFVGMLQQGLVAVDSEGRISAANASAMSQFGAQSEADLMGRPLETLTGMTMDHLLGLPEDDSGTRQGRFGDDLVRLRLRPPGSRHAGKSPAGLQGHDALDRLLAGREPDLSEQLAKLRRLRDRDIPFFISGETGTGKEYLARAIHDSSRRADRAFVALNCAAIPAELIESELFGYRAGAVTGAHPDGMTGKLRQADGGTLFLDEIGDMPSSLQTRLLRVLETGEVMPLGGRAPQQVSFQLLSASHQDLELAIREGRFREDLYYRINGFNVHLPALRERRDLPGLIRRILLEESGRTGPVKLSSPAMDALIHCQWPGNLRQLRHALRVAIGLCDDGVIRLADLPKAIRNNLPDIGDRELRDTGNADARPQREELVAALHRQRWNVRRAAQDLGISRNTLYRRMHRFGIPLQHNLS